MCAGSKQSIAPSHGGALLARHSSVHDADVGCFFPDDAMLAAVHPHVGVDCGDREAEGRTRFLSA